MRYWATDKACSAADWSAHVALTHDCTSYAVCKSGRNNEISTRLDSPLERSRRITWVTGEYVPLKYEAELGCQTYVEKVKFLNVIRHSVNWSVDMLI